MCVCVCVVQTFVQVGVGEAAAQLLDDVDGLQVARSSESEHGLHRQLGEVILMVCHQLGGERGARDVHQIQLELQLVAPAGTHTHSALTFISETHTHTHTQTRSARYP